MTENICPYLEFVESFGTKMVLWVPWEQRKLVAQTIMRTFDELYGNLEARFVT